MDELTPVVRELAGHPIAFLGGFVSGLLRLNLADDPVKSWLEQQGGFTPAQTSSFGQNTRQNNSQSNGNGPQQISIE